MDRFVLHGSLMTDRAAANREVERAFGLQPRSVTGPEALQIALARHPGGQIVWQGHGAAVAGLGIYADRLEAALTALDQFTLETD